MNEKTYFDGNDITTVTGLKILRRESRALPKRGLAANKIAGADRSALSSAYYEGKEVIIEGFISRASQVLLEQSIDTLKGMLQGIEKKLEMMQSGSLRRWYATLSDAIFVDNQGGFCSFSLKFFCSDPLAYEVAATALTFTNPNTAASVTNTANVIGGGYPAEPVFTITVGAVSGGAGKYIKISNPTSGAGITVTRTWAAADVLEVDCLNRTVKVNGVEVDYTGVFPSWAFGETASIRYDDNFTTSRSVTIAGSYTKRRL